MVLDGACIAYGPPAEHMHSPNLQSWTKVVKTLSEKGPFRSTSEFFNV